MEHLRKGVLAQIPDQISDGTREVCAIDTLTRDLKMSTRLHRATILVSTSGHKSSVYNVDGDSIESQRDSNIIG